MLPAHFFNGRFNGRTLKLNHLPALTALQMLMLRIAVVVFVVHARPQFQATQQSRIDQLGEGAIDRGPADAEARFFHVVNKLIGVEMVVLAENESNHVALLIGKALGGTIGWRDTRGTCLPDFVTPRPLATAWRFNPLLEIKNDS